MTEKIYTAIGLMSGTSIDAVDAALIKTDGKNVIERLDFVSVPYNDEDKKAIKSCLGLREDKNGLVKKAEEIIHKRHIEAINKLNASSVDIIGFHGHTITHAPEEKFTWQIGDAQKLAKEIGIEVIKDLRINDIKSGGQGAPLLPIYHYALLKSKNIPLPVAILNLGGVANYTYISEDEELLAFDTGPANALIDDFINIRIGKPYDSEGKLAASGEYNLDLVKKWLEHDFFKRPPPKSLDRDAWDILDDVKSMSDKDGAANLTAFTVLATVIGTVFFEKDPYQIFVTGGGRHNLTIMEGLTESLDIKIRNIDEIGCNGDAIEAEGFAYLAVRFLKDLPITFPTTTGVSSPISGGCSYKP